MKMENMKIGFEKEIIANKEMERRHVLITFKIFEYFFFLVSLKKRES